MLWGIYSAIYGEVNVSVEKCVEIKGDYVEKQQCCFVSVTLVRLETLGPHYVCPISLKESQTQEGCISPNMQPYINNLTFTSTCREGTGGDRKVQLHLLLTSILIKPGIESRWRRDFLYPSITDPGPTEPPVQLVQCRIVKGEGSLCLMNDAPQQERRISGISSSLGARQNEEKMQGSTALSSCKELPLHVTRSWVSHRVTVNRVTKYPTSSLTN